MALLVFDDDASNVTFMDKITNLVAKLVRVNLEVFEELTELFHVESVTPNRFIACEIASRSNVSVETIGYLGARQPR